MKWALAVLVLSSACQRHGDDRASLYGAYHAPPASEITAVDPRFGYQLLSGFLPLDGQSHRWTQRHFAILLAVPREPQALVEVSAFAPVDLTLRCTFDGQPSPPLAFEHGKRSSQGWPVAVPAGATAILECDTGDLERRGALEVGVALFQVALRRP